MSGHGFIGPDESRVDRLDRLITEALQQMDRSALSPEAQQLLADLESEDAVRRERALRSAAKDMATDPLGVEQPPTQEKR